MTSADMYGNPIWVGEQHPHGVSPTHKFVRNAGYLSSALSGVPESGLKAGLHTGLTRR